MTFWGGKWAAPVNVNPMPVWRKWIIWKHYWDMQPSWEKCVPVQLETRTIKPPHDFRNRFRF